MNPEEFEVRRATLDDLDGLKTLWEQARLPVLELERHLTEFQVVVTPAGGIIGALGLRVQGKHGLLHSEAFVHPEAEDGYRPRIWQRLMNIARNRGLARLWTLEESPFWHQQGFAPPTEDVWKKFPVELGNPRANWATLSLRDESQDAIALEKEFELFQQTQRASTEQLMQSARLFKYLAWVILVIAVVAGVIFLAKVFTRVPPSRFIPGH